MEIEFLKIIKDNNNLTILVKSSQDVVALDITMEITVRATAKGAIYVMSGKRRKKTFVNNFDKNS